MRHLEDALQASVCCLLDLYEVRGDLIYFAVPNGGNRNRREAGRLKRQGVRAGVADLVILFNERVVFVELKTEDGRQSKAQKRFQSDAERFRHSYYVCRSLKGVQDVIDTELKKGR